MLSNFNFVFLRQILGPCDFEKDMCGYKDISTGKFEFQRSQPLKDGMKNGPSVDHTLMTNKGKSNQRSRAGAYSLFLIF